MANGWWNLWGAVSGCVLAYQPIGASSLNASYLNLMNPGKWTARTSGSGIAPTLTVNGWKMNQSNTWLEAGGLIPDGTTQAKSMLVSVIGATYTTGILCGTHGSSQRFEMSTGHAGYRFFGNGGSANGGASQSEGVYAVAGAYGYYNGKTDTSAISFSSNTQPTLFIGGRHFNTETSASYVTNGTIRAFAYYNVTLTAVQVAAISRAMLMLPKLHPLDLMARYMPATAEAIASGQPMGLRRWGVGTPRHVAGRF